MIDVVPNAGVIALGKQGENQAVRVTLPNIRAGSGSILLLHQRAADRQPYPAPVVEADGGIIWTVSSTDTAYPGRGQAELQWLGADGAVIKSVTYQTNVIRALTSPGAVPDEPLKPYTQAVARNAQAAKNAAASATEAARNAEASAGQAGLSADNAAKTLKKLEDGIASGDFRGEKGDKGDRGDVGPAGDTTAADAAAEAAKKAAKEAQKTAENCTGEVSALKEDLETIKEEKIKPEDTTFYEGTYNIFDFTDSSRIIPNAYINGSKGVTQYDGWCCTDYIRVEQNVEYCILGYYSRSTGWDYTSDRYCAFYTPTKKYIASFRSGSAFTTPKNCQYIRISIASASPFILESKRIFAKYSDVSSFIQTKTPDNYRETLYNIKADNITKLTEKVDKLNNVENFGAALILREKLIPPYYLLSAENPISYDDIEYLEGKIKNVPSGKHFIFVTDPHWPSNQKNSPALISYMMIRLGINTVIMGGDILDRSDTKYKGASELLSYTATMKSAIGDKYLPVLGNHDVNTANTEGYTAEQLKPLTIPYDIVFKNIFPSYVSTDKAPKLDSLSLDKKTISDLHSYMRCHYYYDDFPNKIRYINIVTGTTNPGNPKIVFELSNYSELLLQFDWLYDVLMNIPSGFDVVLCGHALVSWGSTASPESDQVKSYALYVMQMLSALKTKGSCTVTNDKNNAKLNLYFSAGDHNYDFSNAPNVGTILALGGDTHWDCQCVCHNKSGTYISETISDSTVYQDDSVIAIVTQTDSQGKSSYSGKDYAEKVYKMTIGTVSEQCFDIVTIGNGITFTRIGAGNDRYFNYN